MTRYDYTIFGLALRANRRLATLEVSERHAAPDVTLHLLGHSDGGRWPAPEAIWEMESPPLQIWKARTPEGVYLRVLYTGVDGHTEFVIDPAGTELWARWQGTTTIADVSALLFGPIFGCLLRHRGVTCLHGSVVRLHGQAVALVGGKGAGKSTTAMSLFQRGATVLTDDIAVLARHDETFGVRAGQPHLRLGPESAGIFGSYEALEPLWSRAAHRPQKRYLNAGLGQDRESGVIPLAAVYLLEPRDGTCRHPSIEAASATESLTKLMAHRYTVFALNRSGHARDFAVLGRLVASTPVRQVYRANSLDHLSQLTDMIIDDARTLIARRAAVA